MVNILGETIEHIHCLKAHVCWNWSFHWLISVHYSLKWLFQFFWPFRGMSDKDLLTVKPELETALFYLLLNTKTFMLSQALELL